jgi:hypothetical protein
MPVRSLMLLSLGVALLACSNGTEGAVDAPGDASAETASILDFSAPGLDGPAVQGADYSGRDVALWFWAPW